MEKATFCLFLSLSISHTKLGDTGCSLPVDWDGEFHDSSDSTQDITITRYNNYVVGWSLTVLISTVSSWTCVDEDKSNNLLLFKSNQTIDVFGAPHDAYRCIKYGMLTIHSYSYLILANIESNAGNKRVLIMPTNTVADIRSACNQSNGLPSAVETIVLVKKGYIAKAAQSCPSPFLGCYNYSLNDGSTTYCDGTSVWDVCSDRTQMVVNYTLCSKKQFFSNGGVAYCAYSTSVGSNYYVTVVNADSTVDFTTTFRFTCYAVTSSGGYVYASDNIGACVQNQSPYNKSVTGTGTLVLSAYKTRSSISDVTTETSDDNIGVIVGSLAGVVVLVAAVVAVVLIYKKCQQTH
eukprot:XP_011421976.2 PREDICTED: uncharacterized protein LOC105324561 [Crassostrea gigas]